MNARFTLLIAISLFISSVLNAQERTHATVSGRITDTKGIGIELVNIAISGQPGGTASEKSGLYSLEIASGKKTELLFSFIGFELKSETVFAKKGEKIILNVILKESSTDLPSVSIEDKQLRSTSLNRIDPKAAAVIPTLGGGIEALVKTMPGVSSNNELSSQYSVRGGNFDENLVYVNDFEVYRPFLIRAGQQEGLSFLNPDMVSSILFSAGGFDAVYGDKMSSVLDIQYKRPIKFGGSVNLSLLGGSFHLEGISKNEKLTYLLGVRQKSNQYVLSALETKGDYKPSFTDIQTNLNYQISKTLEVSFLGNLSLNSYVLQPTDRETDFGTINEAYRLKIYFEGQERDHFTNYMGAFSTTWKPSEDVKLKLMASGFQSIESENYDILGQYWIGQIDTDLGSDEFGGVLEAKGIGSYLNHARNQLEATVFNVEHRGSLLLAGDNYLQWGLKFQHEKIDDYINEWEMIDSSGYSVPRPPDSIGYTNPASQLPYPLMMNYRLQTNISMQSNRISGFIQKTWNFLTPQTDYIFSAGIRTQYWDFNKQWIVSPRATLSIKPDWENDFLFRFSAGAYHQPPFYRELRGLDGKLNENIKAQSSFQFLAGSDFNFTAWKRPFKFITEVYFKKLDNLIPYDIDNVRIRYYAENSASGYAAGIDFKVNGEFVKGADSWVSLSLLKTMEDIQDDFYWEYYNKEGATIIPGYTTDVVAIDSARIEPGMYPRPTDQRIMFNLFFQDYLPNNPTYKMHLNLVFGSGLPFGPPKSQKYLQTYRIPPYRRVDIGFSKQIKGENQSMSGFLKHFKSVWITAEVFNLLQFSNTVSYIWVTDVSGRKYAIPNYLTPRQINIKLAINF
ncbi:MAG: carboxypeptidase-like regulatory domain-containing protein [Bacteroidales bacterium]|nr:carboxypeptidase-like regulatory domain-containing protein [Bacteroidales bacterium]